MADLTKRYLVMPMATEAPFDLTDPEGAFVLKPWKDPAALRALATYRDNCYPGLARGLDRWIRAIQAGPVIRGGVGARNERFLRPERGRTAAGPQAKSGAKKKPKAARAKRKRR